MAYTYTLSDLKADLGGILHGVNLNQVQNILGVVNRATGTLLSDIDVFETKVLAQVTPAIYDKIYNYAVPADLKINKIVDLRPQVNRTGSQNLLQVGSKSFDLNKSLENGTLTVENVARVKTLRVNVAGTAPVVLNTCNGITDNGTWAVGGDAENLSKDTLNYISGGASLKFDLDGSTTSGYLQNTTATVVDLTEDENESSLFLWVYIPDATTITSFDLRWGEDITKYWNRTVTTAHFGAFVNGWNLLRFDWDGATLTGAPDVTLTQALRFTVNYDGVADTDFRLDNIISAKGNIWDLQYYSNNIYEDGTTAAVKNRVENDTDIILLEPTTINGLLFKCAEYCAQQINQQGQTYDVAYFSNEYRLWKKEYTGDYKSEKQKIINTYHSVNRRS